LTEVFKALGFDVEIFENLKKKDLLYYIEGLRSRDLSAYASLIVCILSHGDENVVEGTDGKSLNINELKYKFNSNDCPSLNGNPKFGSYKLARALKINHLLDSLLTEGPNRDRILIPTVITHQDRF
jgi:hypothetical protein